jgi:hypothetical protein
VKTGNMQTNLKVKRQQRQYQEVVNKEVLAVSVVVVMVAITRFFLNLCSVVVLMVVAEALNIKARTLTLNCTLI